MAYKRATQIIAWSFSRYSTYQTCPLKLKLSAIDKIPQPGSPAMDRGTAIHKLAEDFVKGTIPRLPKELKQFDSWFRAMRKKYKTDPDHMSVEDTWAFTKTFDETTWNDWANCWLRVKLDLAELSKDETTLHVTDYKTGKYRDDQNEAYCEQLELYALAALLLYPSIKEVRPRLMYLDHGILFPEAMDAKSAGLVFTHKDIPRLKKLWAKRTKPMLVDKSFAPKPNRFCGWCHYRRDNGLTDAKGKPLCQY